jgi:hypothetical protein
MRGIRDPRAASIPTPQPVFMRKPLFLRETRNVKLVHNVVLSIACLQICFKSEKDGSVEMREQAPGFSY